MLPAYEEVTGLLERICNEANSPVVDALADQLTELVARYMADPERKNIVPGIDLAPNEHSILELLSARVGTTVPKWALLENTKFRKGTSSDRTEKNVDVYVCRLRHKLKDTSYVIETDWGQGYRLIKSSPQHAQGKAA